MITNRQHTYLWKYITQWTTHPSDPLHDSTLIFYLHDFKHSFQPHFQKLSILSLQVENLLPSLPHFLLHLSSLISPFLRYFPIPRKGECGMEKRTLLHSSLPLSFLPSFCPHFTSILSPPHSSFNLIPSNLKFLPLPVQDSEAILGATGMSLQSSRRIWCCTGTTGVWPSQDIIQVSNESLYAVSPMWRVETVGRYLALWSSWKHVSLVSVLISMYPSTPHVLLL